MCRSSRTPASRHRLSRAMWASRMYCRDSTHFFSVFGRTGSCFSPAFPVAAVYQKGSVSITRKAARPVMILPVSYIALLLHFADGLLFYLVDGFQAQVDRPLLLPLHDESVGHQFVDAGDLDARGPVVADRRERRPVDGAHGDQAVHAVLLLDVAHRVAAGEPAAQPHLHVLVRAQAGAAAAAERLLADGVYGHLFEVVADVPEDIPRLLAHPHRARGGARVVE